MWGTVLPSLQPVADKNGFGEEWRVMCETRTEAAANAAANAAAECKCRSSTHERKRPGNFCK
jgi:hypothetical protein